MKIALAFVTAACWMLAIHSAAFAQPPQPAREEASRVVRVPILTPGKFEARVDLVLDIPESIENPFRRCIVQELKSLGDVTLTDRNPRYRITVMALPNKTREEIIGFTFSVLVTRPFDENLLRPLLMSRNIGENEKRMLYVVGASYEKIEKASLLTSSPDELGSICRQIVSGFNDDLLEKDRLLWKSAWKLPTKPPEKTPEKNEDRSAPKSD